MPHPIHIDEEQNRAIRDELGARLRMIHQLEGKQRVPRRIRESLDRLAELDLHIQLKVLPSIVSSENEGWLRRLLLR